jgi:ADP-heptose:LPS heptosyltransferase
LLKALELLLRRSALRLFARCRRPSGPLPADIDFNSCRFLFVRQDRIGDVLVSTPVFEALRRHYPKARFDIVVSPNNLAAVAGNRLFSRRWIYTKRPWDTLRLIRSLRRERYDVAIDLMDNPSATSTIFMLLAGARWNVGLRKENERVYDVAVPLLSRKDTHIVDRLAEILRVFRIDPATEDLRVTYVPQPASFEAVNALFRDLGLMGTTVVAVNISAGSEARSWEVEKYRELVRRIAEKRSGARFLILAKPQDAGRCAEIAAGIPTATICPALTFDQFAAAVAGASVLITPDTAAVHLAAAARVPAVVLYVQSDPELRIWDPYRSPSEAVITSSRTLADVSVEDVLEAFERLSRRVDFKPASKMGMP